MHTSLKRSSRFWNSPGIPVMGAIIAQHVSPRRTASYIIANSRESRVIIGEISVRAVRFPREPRAKLIRDGIFPRYTPLKRNISGAYTQRHARADFALVVEQGFLYLFLPAAPASAILSWSSALHSLAAAAEERGVNER